jgi:hypothetical protein
VKVECLVDWRKMTLTNSDNYARLKRSGVDLLGAFCTPKDPMIGSRRTCITNSSFILWVDLFGTFLSGHKRSGVL